MKTAVHSVAIWAFVLGTACSGTVYTVDASVVGGGGTNGTVSVYPCNQANPTGHCPTGTCLDGVCYSTLPAECAAGSNGSCPDKNQTCANGLCVSITHACSPTNLTGECTGGQVCVLGYCFVDDGHVLCAPDNINGACPPGQSCQGGQCKIFIPVSCNASDWGGCGTWQVCAEGNCLGPVPPDACSTQLPSGRCPAGEVCIAGTCGIITPDSACSASNTTGLCPGGAACVGGACVMVTGNLACSPTNPGGLCTGGATCRGGQCVAPACGNGGYACPAGQRCDNNNCIYLPCGPTNPSGSCTDPSDACVQGVCTQPTCSPADPNGVCPNPLVCTDGVCMLPPCSVTSPDGPCPDPNNQVCSSGHCITRPCSATATEGTCTSIACTLDPLYGCIYRSPSQCCDATLSSQTACTVGTCSAPACSIQNPNGQCPSSNTICQGGTCVPAPCSPFYSNGVCSNADEQCVLGRCTKPSCASQPDSDAYCSPLVCDRVNNVCKQPPCSTLHQGGSCPVGTTCCSTAMSTPSDPNYNPACTVNAVGTCIPPTCSASFPGGACADGNTRCSNGVCQMVPCSPTYPHGPCGANFTCTGGTCTLLPCAQSAGEGTCASGQVCSPKVGGGYACAPYVCSNSFPQAPCANNALQCVNLGAGGNPNYTCIVPACSPQYPGGTCSDPNRQICANGNCILAGCSPTHLAGVCPRSQTCVSGRCQLDTCANADPNDSGTCAPQNGNAYACCNNVLVASGFCTSGQLRTCVMETCSSQFPFAGCANPNNICVTQNGNTACRAVCNSSNKQGFCPGGFACVEGACAPPCTNDQDCDTISDVDEGNGAVDTDSDGVPDAYDHDSDGDTIPDSVEAGDKDIATPPRDTDHDGIGNFRSLDSDADYIADKLEAGPAPGVPLDTDGDGAPNYVDTDSDNDGILDKCEAKDVGTTLCFNTSLITSAMSLANSDGVGAPDYLSTDSDGDKISDNIEARQKPSQANTLNPLGVDHDGDQIPDYRDPDSDNDGVADQDEDVNGDGIVNCQVNGTGNVVPDTRAAPTCGSTSSPFSSATPYDYNPGCPTQKCLLAETNRVFADTDGNGIPDGQDGVFLVCSAANLKPINVFYSPPADYALALEQTFTNTTTLRKSSVQVGMTFDDPVTTNGSYAVSGFLLNHAPSTAALSATNSNPNQILTSKALAQAQSDYVGISGLSTVSLAAQVLNRNFLSFDGYGVAVSRYEVTTRSPTSVGNLRDQVARLLAGGLDSFSPTDRGPAGVTDFQVIIETVYRYDNATTGTVISVGAVVPTGADANTTNSYNYRSQCNLQTTSGTCNARPGCTWNTSCQQQNSYQIPLFYADNITNGSALTQYGDDIASLCESLVQKNGVVDFLWTVDNSGSMAPKIGQVVKASSLFFPILANSEADYRVGMVTTTANSPYWPPVFPGCFGNTNRQQCENSSKYGGQTNQGGCSWDVATSKCWPACTNNTTQAACTNPNRPGCVWDNTHGCTWGGCAANTNQTLCTNQVNCVWANGRCDLVGTPDLINGNMGDFTGAVAGLTTSSIDRSYAYTCKEGCVINTCSAHTNSSACAADLSCAWTGSKCIANCCPACLSNPNATPNDPACYFAARLPNDNGSGDEFGLLMTEWALMRAGAQPVCTNATSLASCVQAGCYWDGAACIPNYCNNAYVSDSDPNVTNTPQAHCLAWQNGSASTPPLSPIGNAAVNHYGEYENPAVCEWNPQAPSGPACFPSMGMPCFSFTNQATCAAQGTRCAWGNNACVPNEVGNRVLCNGTTQVTCQAQGNGFCQWDNCSTYVSATACEAVYGCAWDGNSCSAVANGGTCRPPLKRMFRNNAAKVAVILSDEEECYDKDGPNSSGGGGTQYDGNCAGGQYQGGLLSYTDPVRISRTNAYQNFIQSRGVTVFGLVGDKADPTKPVATTSPTNGGCAQGYTAEAGQTYINVAEGSSGGWGSLCATNLFPSIESVVITGLSQASPYKLEGFINDHSVQPIASTIKVAAQVCKVASEYPNCASGTQVVVVPRSRDSGYDYNPSTNTIVLYGTDRALTQGSITVSYRYWVNRQQPPNGTSGSCPCPETSGPGCACPAGEACGIVGTTNKCTLIATSTTCANTPGCVWNTSGGSGGFCEATGLCTPDPTCGGACGAGTTCDPARGLCVCDVACGGSCQPGSQCDNNANFHACAGLSQGSCSGTSGCTWNATLAACLSATCGTCVCDTTCGGGCPAGEVCNSNPNSPTCGQCSCDTTCSQASNGQCPANEACNGNLTSPTCGFCEPPSCSPHCPSNYICNPAANICVCDTSCGGGTPPAGQVCDSNTTSPTCGQLICDKTCGGSCPAHEICNTDSNSASCGFCTPDPTCGMPHGNCNPTCAADSNSACAALAGCVWKLDGNGAMGCYPAACQVCDGTNGTCKPDTVCAACGCNNYETCNPSTGACQCDTTCHGACPAGRICDRNLGDATCGQCVCDTTCGGPCSVGQRCDQSTTSSTCGQCIIDQNCGTGCPYPKVCNSNTGLCEVSQNCGGGCPQGYVCNAITGQCVVSGG